MLAPVVQATGRAVRMTGFEPARAFAQRLLRPPRLPVPPHPQTKHYSVVKEHAPGRIRTCISIVLSYAPLPIRPREPSTHPFAGQGSNLGSPVSETGVLPTPLPAINSTLQLSKRTGRIELPPTGWKPVVLPLNHVRIPSFHEPLPTSGGRTTRTPALYDAEPLSKRAARLGHSPSVNHTGAHLPSKRKAEGSNPRPEGPSCFRGRLRRPAHSLSV